MKALRLVSYLFFLLGISFNSSAKNNSSEPDNNNIKDITVKDINKKDVKLSDYKGKVLLIVNVASKCGYTPQYKGLEALYEKYNNQGFEILAFPCNDFGGQEPGTNEEIQQFCNLNYNVKFKLFDKIEVVGENKSPLYSNLTNNNIAEKGDVKWNFEKFLIDKEGNIVARFRSKVTPDNEDLVKAIEKELAK
jgi:glutathione peroxidase